MIWWPLFLLLPLLPSMRTALYEVSPIQHGSQWCVGKSTYLNHLGNIFGSPPQSQQAAKSIPPHLLEEVLSAGEGPKHKYPLESIAWTPFWKPNISTFLQQTRWHTVSKLNTRALPPILNYVPWFRVGTSVRATNDLKAISYNHVSPTL